MLDIETILKNYDKYIRSSCTKRADIDYQDDAYQEIVMSLMNKIDEINKITDPEMQKIKILSIIKNYSRPTRREQKKLVCYNGWTNDDNEDTTEEWLLEDDTYNPENMIDAKKRLFERQRAEDYDVVTKKDTGIKQAISLFKEKNIYNKLARSGFYRYSIPNEIKKSLSILRKLQKKVGIRDMSMAALYDHTARGWGLCVYHDCNRLKAYGRQCSVYLKWLNKRSANEQ